MLPGEFSEFLELNNCRKIGCIFIEFDADAPSGEPGIITPIARALVSDRDIEGLGHGALLRRLNSGISYELKTLRRAGVGVTQLDLSRAGKGGFERNF